MYFHAVLLITRQEPACCRVGFRTLSLKRNTSSRSRNVRPPVFSYINKIPFVRNYFLHFSISSPLNSHSEEEPACCRVGFRTLSLKRNTSSRSRNVRPPIFSYTNKIFFEREVIASTSQSPRPLRERIKGEGTLYRLQSKRIIAPQPYRFKLVCI